MGVNMRTPAGTTEYVPDDQVNHALSQGYSRQSDEDAGAAVTAPEKSGEGVGGAVLAGVTSVASGATLGASDVALRGVLSKGDLRSVKEAREAHPFVSMGGQIVGALGTGLAGEGSLLARTPAGYLARIAGEGMESARAVGGIEGALGVAASTGAEGAIQNGGMYLSDTALGDRDLTAEGMACALGSGFAFGSVAGGATYGLEKGTIAARRMFARLAEGGEQAGTDAANAFDRSTDEVLQAHSDTADIARARLEEIRGMKQQALESRGQADLELANARATAPRPEPFAEPPVAPEAAPATSAPEAPSPSPSPSAAIAAPAADSTTRLERQLAEMRDKIEGGATIQDLNAARSPVVNTEALLGPDVAAEEKKLTEALSGYEAKREAVDSWLDKVKNPRTSVEADAAEIPLVRGMRTRNSSALGEDVFVEQSGGQLRTIGNGEHALSDITPNSRILARSNGESFSHGAVLDDAYNDAIERARLAETPHAQDAALHEAADIEQQTHRYVRDTKPENAAVIDKIESARAATGKTGFHAAFARAERRAMDEAEATSGVGWAKGDKYRPHVAIEAHEAAQTLGGYEKAAADLTDAVGDAAPHAAQDAAAGLRSAEANAEARATERTSRAIDDHVASQGPIYQSPTERIAAAKAQKLEANATIARLKVAETEAKKAIPAGATRAKAVEKLKSEVVTPAPKAAEAPGKFQRARDIAEKVGGAAELASMAGIPGVPSPHDIPVIGPLLGAYLKFRAFTGKLTGRIPATGEARAAVLAAQTRNKIAQSVDRMLGLAERAAPLATHAAVATTTRVGDALAKRLYDDGQPDAPKGASIQQVAAVRSRELAAAATDPQGVIAAIRKQLVDVADPALIAAVEQHQVAKLNYLNDKAPKAPPPGIFAATPWMPSPSEAAKLACRVEVANDPTVALTQVENGAVSIEATETLHAVWPKLFAEMQQRLIERAHEVTNSIPYQQTLRMGILFNVPLDPLSNPATIASLQSLHAPANATPSQAAPTQNTPPMPSIAGPVNVASLFQPTTDRRSQLR